MSESDLTIEEMHAEEVCVVVVSGRIDSANADNVKGRLTDLLASGEKAVLVDMSNLLYLTSAGFRALLMATDEAEQRSAWFALCGMPAIVRDLFEMGGLADAFTIFDSRREAVASRA